jgi:hypothetical protein
MWLILRLDRSVDSREEGVGVSEGVDDGSDEVVVAEGSGWAMGAALREGWVERGRSRMGREEDTRKEVDDERAES